MACKLVSINGKSNSYSEREYLCDTEEEINLLPKYGINGKFNSDKKDNVSNEPCAIGSVALVLKPTVSVWMLSPSNRWEKL